MYNVLSEHLLINNKRLFIIMIIISINNINVIGNQRSLIINKYSININFDVFTVNK